MSAYPAQPSYYAPASQQAAYAHQPDQAQPHQQQQQAPSSLASPSLATQPQSASPQSAQVAQAAPAPQQPHQQQPQQPQQPYYYQQPQVQAGYPYGYAPATTMAASSDMGYQAYPYQYQQIQQPPQAASYLQPYQYLQQQQQQQALYQQQYQNAYHQHQGVPMMHTITDPTGQKPPPNIKPKITTTLWEDEGTLCFQVEARGICVARREDNDMINGTKLLNVAGMTRGRRDGILKGEKNRHVVKAGAMHLKGVWIPYARALDFANREKIIDLLYPLFVTDLKVLLYHPANFARTAQVLNAAEKRKAEKKDTEKDDVKQEDDNEKKLASPTGPPTQQSLSGRFSVDRIVSTTPSSTPPATSSSTPNGKPYYFNVPDQYESINPGASAAYVSPTSRISTPVSAPEVSHNYMQRYQGTGAPTQGAPAQAPGYAPQLASYSQMYTQQVDTRVPLVSPASSTSGGNATPNSEAAAPPDKAQPVATTSPKKETSYE